MPASLILCRSLIAARFHSFTPTTPFTLPKIQAPGAPQGSDTNEHTRGGQSLMKTAQCRAILTRNAISSRTVAQGVCIAMGFPVICHPLGKGKMVGSPRVRGRMTLVLYLTALTCDPMMRVRESRAQPNHTSSLPRLRRSLQPGCYDWAPQSTGRCYM